MCLLAALLNFKAPAINPLPNLKKTIMRNILSTVPALLLACIVIFFSCQKDYSIETGASYAASGTLYDTSGSCGKDSVVGTFYNGVTPGRDTAYVLVKVTVSKAGTYNIVSNIQNGLYFSDSGYFSNTGVNTIKLKPVGTPIIPGTDVFSISLDSSTCTFSVTTLDSTGTGLGGSTGGGGTGGGGTGGGGSTTAGAWSFTTASGTIGGNNASGILASALGINALSITGTSATADSILNIQIGLPSATIPSSGSFKTGASTGFSLQSFSSPTKPIYEADFSTSQQITITITSYNSATRELIGTFSGNAKDKSGNTAAITNGSFDVIVQ